ncbi:hypothetical protein BJ944DRAFT_253455 [Cunninghamella echinulata]|nr:hypothetical protein BJ944DRAFT_253455 [Cunninghamella echinulata]
MTTLIINTEAVQEKDMPMEPYILSKKNYSSSDWQSDDDDDDDGESDTNPEDQEQFDRISGILSALIQEANEAIQTLPSTALKKNKNNLDNNQDGDDNEYDDDDDDDDYLLNMSNTITTTPTIYSSPSNSSSTTLLPNMIPSTSSTLNDIDNMLMMKRSHSHHLRRPSRLPRPKKLSLSTTTLSYYPMNRERSDSNLSTCTSMSSSLSSMINDDDRFSSASTELTTPMSRTTSPLFEKSIHTPHPSSLLFDNDVSFSYMMTGHEHDHDHSLHYKQQHQQKENKYELEKGYLYETDYPLEYVASSQDKVLSPTDPLLASFERLDSSLALVDSLSRDLANHRKQHTRTPSSTSISIPTPSSHPLEDEETSMMCTNNQKYKKNSGSNGGSSKWTFFLLFPLVHIPYVLFTMILDGATSTTKQSSSSATSSSPTMISSSTTSHLIDQRILSPLAGLSVFILFMSIIHLVTNSGNNSNNNNSMYEENIHDWYQTMKDDDDMDRMDNDEWMAMIKMERRASLPILSSSSSTLLQLQRRNSS